MQVLPVNQLDLIHDTRKYLQAIMSCVRNVWKADIRLRFSGLYNYKDDVSATANGVLFFDDHTSVPVLRCAVLAYQYTGENEIFGRVNMLVVPTRQLLNAPTIDRIRFTTS